MGIVRKYWEIIKLFFKYIRFKLRQSRLKTNEKFVVTTTYGPILGVKRISVWNDSFYSFEKIPFAKPPLGELRFKAPQPPDPWTELKDCTAEGPVPLQTNLISKRMEGSEDCLYLNVYTKSLKPDKLMPVMVWIYGGGFETGGATKDLYSPDYFMQKDVVLVEITYRVGPFGFLSFNDPDLNIPGNAGLKDQVLALKWIKTNCSEFGGNPDNITLFGESAGAASTHYMMLTDQTKGLFHRAILMSGTALCPWALHSKERKIGYRLARKLGYQGPDTNDKEVFNILKNADGKKILTSAKNIQNENERTKCIILSFGPTVEPYITKNCVIPEEPRLMMRKAWSNEIPILIGGTSFEGLLFYQEKKLNPDLMKNLGNCTNLVPLELNLNDDSTEQLDYGLKLRKEYFKEAEPSIKTFNQYLDLLSYKIFWHGIHRTILSRQKYASSTQTYIYRFDVDSENFNWLRLILCGPKKRGVCHADDIGFLFLHMCSPTLSFSSKEYRAVQAFLGSFVKFAETGNPNHLEFGNVNWKPFQKEDNERMMCLNFNFNIDFVPLPEFERNQLWDSFYPKELLF